jgi:hypothetical protein
MSLAPCGLFLEPESLAPCCSASAEESPYKGGSGVPPSSPYPRASRVAQEGSSRMRPSTSIRICPGAGILDGCRVPSGLSCRRGVASHTLSEGFTRPTLTSTCGGSVVLANEGDSPKGPISRINNRETVLRKVWRTPLAPPHPDYHVGHVFFWDSDVSERRTGKNAWPHISRIRNSRSCTLQPQAGTFPESVLEKSPPGS